LTYDLIENAQANGLALYTQHKVKSISRQKNGYFVCESKEKFKTRFVINAAGLWADEIAALVGIKDFQIKPRKGEEYLLDKKRSDLTKHIIFPLPHENSKGILVIKTSDSNPMIGPTAQEIDDKHDLTTTAAGLDQVLQSVKKLVPAIETRDIIAYFAGLRPSAGQDFIIRHEDQVPGMITVAGIQSPGLTASPAIALMVTELLKKNGLKLKKKDNFKKHRPPTAHLFSSVDSEIKKLIKKDSAYGDIVCRCEMVSAKEIREAIKRGARTMDGIKFRTRAQAGRCHGGFCTTRIMKIMAEELGLSLTKISKRGPGTEIVVHDRQEENHEQA
jgi:glycerol-3-phosphate dehydrogenase